MFTDANQIQVLIIGGSEPVGILPKFSIIMFIMGVESLKRREASPMEVAFTLFIVNGGDWL